MYMRIKKSWWKRVGGGGARWVIPVHGLQVIRYTFVVVSTDLFILFYLLGPFRACIWCEVPHCDEDHAATTRCFVLGRFNLRMGCFLDIKYIVSF